MSSMEKEHVIFLSLSLISLPMKLKTKNPLFSPDPISLRLNFWKESKTNRHLPLLMDNANICSQSMASRIFLYFFLLRSNRFTNYFCEGLEQLLLFGSKKISVYTTTFNFSQMSVMVS